MNPSLAVGAHFREPATFDLRTRACQRRHRWISDVTSFFCPRLGLLLFWAVLQPALCEAQPLKVELVSSPVLNAPIKVTISSMGKVGVENGLKQISEVLTVADSRVVDLGTATAPGFYEFRFRAAEQSEWLMVPVLSDGIPTKPKAVELSKAEEDALLQFLQLHTKERCGDNWKKWPLGAQIGVNIVKVTTAGVLIIACPFEAVACGPAAVETINLAFDFAIDFEMFQAQEFQKARLLTKSHMDTVLTVLKRVKQGKSTLSIRGKMDAAFAAMDLVLLEVNEKDLQIIFGMQVDEAKKARTLITTFKRK
jgi:hypothetical protein